jgi:hypothetical protein
VFFKLVRYPSSNDPKISASPASISRVRRIAFTDYGIEKHSVGVSFNGVAIMENAHSLKKWQRDKQRRTELS